MMEDSVRSMIAITEPFPNGQRITGVAIQYAKEIRNQELEQTDYAVENRRIERVYANTDFYPATEGKDGPFVIIELSPNDKDCETLERPAPPKRKENDNGSEKAERIGGTPRNLKSLRKEIKLLVSQVNEILAVDGSMIPGFESRKTTEELNILVDEFKQFELDGMKYSLYMPKNSEDGRKYPLVMFIPDATGTGDDPRISLEQGNGAVSFITSETQEKYPCFVLSPQYAGPGPLTKDDFTTNRVAVEKIYSILRFVMENYPVDEKRIYTTGQSMGCMTSCELNIRYPELFAASLLVAGQWDPEAMADLYRKNFWILVSEHDAKAFPGMTAVLDAMKKKGGIVEQYYWNAKLPKEELNRKIREAAKSDVNLRFTVFEADSVVPEGEALNPGSNHMCTWPVVYALDALKDWMFAQCKE